MLCGISAPTYGASKGIGEKEQTRKKLPYRERKRLPLWCLPLCVLTQHVLGRVAIWRTLSDRSTAFDGNGRPFCSVALSKACHYGTVPPPPPPHCNMTNALASSSLSSTAPSFTKQRPRSRRSQASASSSRSSSIVKLSSSRKNSLVIVVDNDPFLPPRRASIAALPSSQLCMTATAQRYPLTPLSAQMQSIHDYRQRQGDTPLASAFKETSIRSDSVGSGHTIIDYSRRRSSVASMNGGYVCNNS